MLDGLRQGLVSHRRVGGGLAALAILGIVVAMLLPPRARPAEDASWPVRHPMARGAYHVHSNRSDGTGTLDEIASAAAAAGLSFVIVTDHGDGTRAPEPPGYRAGVLMIDAVEISTSGGHYVALGLPQAPYRLAGTPESVIEDVARLGGFGFAAHPDSAKADLRWTDWQADVDGLEWLNVDSEWRDELWASLGRGLVTYFFRPRETLAALLDRPEATLHRWDALGRRHRLVGIAAADAHARLGFRENADPYQDRVIARVPGYEASFEVFQNHVQLDRPLTGDAAADAASVLGALREGHVYTTIDGLAGGSAFELTASSGNERAEMGDYLDIAGDILIEVRAAAPPDTTLVLLRDGEPVAEGRAPTLTANVGQQPGVYRVEARLPTSGGSAPMPWLVSNPIYAGVRAAHRAAETTSAHAADPATTRADVDVRRWRAEVSPGSQSAVEARGAADSAYPLSWRFALAEGDQSSPYAAVQFPIDGGVEAFDRVHLVVRSSRPMRLWGQVRSPATGERWGKTFYVDAVPRDVVLDLHDLAPMEPNSKAPPLARIDSLLIVADTLNHRFGETGEVEIRGVWLER